MGRAASGGRSAGGGCWTTPSQVRHKVQREWDSGRALASVVPSGEGEDEAAKPGEAAALGEGGDAPRVTSFPLRIPLKGPRGADLASNWQQAHDWVRSHEQDTGYRVEWRDVNDRTLGRQRLPAAAWIDTVDEAATLLGTRAELAAFRAAVAGTPPALHGWMRRHPLTVRDAGADWPLLVGVLAWLGDHPRPGVYLREVDVPGVHTKIIETHRRTLASMADWLGIPGEATSGHGWFERRYGFATKPAMVRLRALDPAVAILPGAPDLALRVHDAASLAPRVHLVIVVENEINYLSFPDMAGSLVIFGHGNEAPALLASLPWLRDVKTFYWGDIDTHGFAILDRVRAVVPGVRSLLMDRETLLAHRSAWSVEPTGSTHVMSRLTPDEAAVVESLRSGEFGEHVRLEQERIGWRWLTDAVAELG